MSRSSSRYRVVQPWGPDAGTQSTVISEHASPADAFAAIDALAEQMARTGAPSNAVQFVVVDDAGAVVRRPGTH
jgi:hypothetical protein